MSGMPGAPARPAPTDSPGPAAPPPEPTAAQPAPYLAVKATPLTLPADASAGLAFRLTLDNCLTQLAANEPVFVATRNPDTLHQTRVSWRRARAAFSLCRPLWQHDPRAHDLKARMREIALPLGPARDADVLVARAISEGWTYRVQRALRGRRRRTYNVAVPLLRSPQWLEMKADLRAWLEHPDWLAGAAGLRDSPARVLTDAALQKRYSRIADAGDQLTTLHAHDLHQLRIEGKKFRYGCEFFASLYVDAPGDTPADFATAMGAMQDAFGAANDHASAAHILAAQGARTDLLGPPHEREECVHAWSAVMDLEPFWR